MLSDRRKFIFRGADISVGDFDIFLIGGGGGGGGAGKDSIASGAGGAGAYVAFMRNIPLIRKSYVCTIGQGGDGGSWVLVPGSAGGATSFDRYSVNGGGGGGTATSYPATIKGGSGGTGGGAGGYVRDTSTGGSSSQEFFPGSDGGSNGSDGYGNYETSLHDAILLGGDGDGESKYLFGNTSYDLYCGGGGGGAYEYLEVPGSTGGIGGDGGGGNGANAIREGGSSPATSGTKYGAGGGGGCGGAFPGASGYQGAVFIRKSSGTLTSADFTYTGNWRWYRNNASLGIVEIYGDGVFTLA